MKIYALILFLASLTQITGCSFLETYSVPSIEGKVVDAETKQPIEGAVVVIRRALRGGLEGGTVGYYKNQETVTDINGRYVIPALGKIKIDDVFQTYAPEIIVFKAGYKVIELNNVCYVYAREKNYPKLCEGRSDPHRASEVKYVQDSIWDKETIALERFNGTNEEWRRIIYEVEYELTVVDRPGKCGWRGFDIPKLLRAINNEMLKYSNKGLNITPSSVLKRPNVIGGDNRDCPAEWNQFFKEYQ